MKFSNDYTLNLGTHVAVSGGNGFFSEALWN